MWEGGSWRGVGGKQEPRARGVAATKNEMQLQVSLQFWFFPLIRHQAADWSSLIIEFVLIHGKNSDCTASRYVYRFPIRSVPTIHQNKYHCVGAVTIFIATSVHNFVSSSQKSAKNTSLPPLPSTESRISSLNVVFVDDWLAVLQTLAYIYDRTKRDIGGQFLALQLYRVMKLLPNPGTTQTAESAHAHCHVVACMALQGLLHSQVGWDCTKELTCFFVPYPCFTDRLLILQHASLNKGGWGASCNQDFFYSKIKLFWHKGRNQIIFLVLGPHKTKFTLF